MSGLLNLYSTGSIIQEDILILGFYNSVREDSRILGCDVTL